MPEISNKIAPTIKKEEPLNLRDEKAPEASANPNFYTQLLEANSNPLIDKSKGSQDSSLLALAALEKKFILSQDRSLEMMIGSQGNLDRLAEEKPLLFGRDRHQKQVAEEQAFLDNIKAVHQERAELAKQTKELIAEYQKERDSYHENLLKGNLKEANEANSHSLKIFETAMNLNQDLKPALTKELLDLQATTMQAFTSDIKFLENTRNIMEAGQRGLINSGAIGTTGRFGVITGIGYGLAVSYLSSYAEALSAIAQGADSNEALSKAYTKTKSLFLDSALYSMGTAAALPLIGKVLKSASIGAKVYLAGAVASGANSGIASLVGQAREVHEGISELNESQHRQNLSPEAKQQQYAEFIQNNVSPKKMLQHAGIDVIAGVLAGLTGVKGANTQVGSGLVKKVLKEACEFGADLSIGLIAEIAHKKGIEGADLNITDVAGQIISTTLGRASGSAQKEIRMRTPHLLDPQGSTTLHRGYSKLTPDTAISILTNGDHVQVIKTRDKISALQTLTHGTISPSQSLRSASTDFEFAERYSIYSGFSEGPGVVNAIKDVANQHSKSKPKEALRASGSREEILAKIKELKEAGQINGQVRLIITGDIPNQRIFSMNTMLLSGHNETMITHGIEPEMMKEVTLIISEDPEI